MTHVTNEEVKARLKLSTANEDLLTSLIEEAEDYVVRFIGRPLKVDGEVAPGLRGAVLAYVGFLHDGTPVDLPGLLAPYREWRF